MSAAKRESLDPVEKQRETDDPSIPAGTAQPDDTMEAGEINWAALLLATSDKLENFKGGK